jgi:UDP-3-O-[3-hydroxymyristoyl] glucosamine N-acyltransferase
VYPNVTIGPGVAHRRRLRGPRQCLDPRARRIGHRVVLQDGVVLGGDGYGSYAAATARTRRFRRSAAVVIEDDVEIGANTTVDRPAVGETRIKAGRKIDNLVQIAHGVTVGATR